MAKGEAEAHSSSVSFSSPNIPLDKLNQITPIPLTNSEDLAMAKIAYTEYLNLLTTHLYPPNR